MQGEESIIVTSSGSNDNPSFDSPEPGRPYKKAIIASALVLAVVVLIAAVFLIINNLTNNNKPQPLQNDPDSAQTTASSTPSLPELDDPLNEPESVASSSLQNLAVEYLSFDDFYSALEDDVEISIDDYELPINVKIDVMNYYDVSRKLNLDPYLDNLNNLGFAVIDNPWSKTTSNFSEVYTNLDSKQVPMLVTSDYLFFYYQNILKKVFKDIEENVFYDNLWDINTALYQAAKNRYEARLASIGNINDPILEAERLETAFFAVALELLKPVADQISVKDALDNKQKFSASDAERFYFVVPPYLREDVLSEVSLIRMGKAVSAKSPVLLYNRNYKEFTVPSDYQDNVKLNNFYLTTKWLNSVFPLNYRDQSCPDCLLDKVDWRISLTAASLIAQDFSAQPELSGRWARIYKTVSFFKGLREDYNYVTYRDGLNKLFGEDFKSEELFDSKNSEAIANLEKFRQELLTQEWPDMSGALDKVEDKEAIGFRMLAESYWPNDYIFKKLTTPSVGAYIGSTTAEFNQTICSDKRNYGRCSGMVFDAVNLVYPISGNEYFSENTNYSGYNEAASVLREELDQMPSWHSSNYWSNLKLMSQYLSVSRSEQPIFTGSEVWNNQTLRTAAAAWVNLQLPLQKYTINVSTTPDKGLGFLRDVDNSYVEPNLPLINGILAHNTMLLGMFNALQLDIEVRLAAAELRNFAVRLNEIKEVVLKELRGESLDSEDNKVVVNFIRELEVSPVKVSNQQVKLNMNSGEDLNLDLSDFKIMVLVHQYEGNKVFSVGPVWNYKEGR